MTYESPIGKLTIIAHDGFLTNILYENEALDFKEHNPTNQDKTLLNETCTQLDEYFAGNRKVFELPIKLKGGQFLQTVWKIMANDLKFGTTTCYSDLAKQAGSPKAARAVGMANNRNPIPIIIPCHRVLGKNGKLVGFRWGMDAKIALLKLEGINL